MCGCFFLPTGVWAAGPISLPGSADPSRVFENNKPTLKSEESLDVEEGSKKAVAKPPDGSEKLKFFLQDVTVENMKAYDEGDIRPLYSSYLGKEVSVAQLFEIMTALQQKYLDDGYALTKVVIPNQNITQGHVRFSVIEGHVTEIQMEGDLLESPVIDDAARRIRSMKPLNVKKLERIMLIVNDLPDLNVSAILAKPTQESQDGPGGVRLILKKNAEKNELASLSLDNHGSVFSGPLETKASAHAYHIGTNYSDFEIGGLVTSPLREQRSGYANYSVPVFGASGLLLNMNVSRALTRPGDTLKALEIKGFSNAFETSLVYPLLRQRDQTLRMSAGFEVKNSRTKLLGEELFDDRIRIAKAGLAYNFTDKYAGYSSFSVNYSKGLDILGTRETGSENLSRENGKSDFKKVEMVAARIQALPHNFEMLVIANGQYTKDPLLSSEEFGFGGAQLGRGYDPSEITGDKGISASFELRHNNRVNVMNTVLAIQPYAFFDIGKVWNIDPGAKDKKSGASAGLGVRLDLGNQWSSDLNLATPLTSEAANGPKYQDKLGSRILFSLVRRF